MVVDVVVLLVRGVVVVLVVVVLVVLVVVDVVVVVEVMIVFITDGGGPLTEASKRPPQVRTHSSPDKKLFPFPPQPEYRNFRQLLVEGS